MDAPSTTTELLDHHRTARELVAFDTTSRNSNLALIAFVRAFSTPTAFPIASAPMRPGKKANIHAIIGPQGRAASRCPGMSIPSRSMVRPGPVTRSACAATNGAVCARLGDMKGFVAACLAAVPDMQARSLARPLHLFISYDEETGCQGAQRLVRDLDNSGLKPALCVVGEPSGMKPILAHKGKLNLHVRVRGKPGHSASPTRASTPSTPPPRRSPMSRRRHVVSLRKARSRTVSTRRTPPSMSARSRAAAS